MRWIEGERERGREGHGQPVRESNRGEKAKKECGDYSNGLRLEKQEAVKHMNADIRTLLQDL